MKPYTRSIIELFDGKKRYLIPLYQRQYAWKIAPQLDLLWEDIERAVRYLNTDRAALTPHFMGAMVISQVKTYGKQVQAFEIIDGQQRLTTFQLLLSALRDVAIANGSKYGAELGKYLLNDGVMEEPHVERYKLWPSLIDRRAFVGLIDPDVELDTIAEKPLDEDGVVRRAAGAQAYFKGKIEAHVKVAGVFDEDRLETLFEALKEGLAAVSIELESGDDAQTIFETLNSRGVDLTAGDLMRNFIFQRAKGLGLADGSLIVDKLYMKHWLPLDRAFWNEPASRGRQVRTRLDWMLTDHLSTQVGDLVSVDNLFETYRRWILDKRPFDNVMEELESISATAAVEKRLFEQDKQDALGRFGRFAEAFDVSTTMPLVVYLATDPDVADRLEDALQALESYILRRDICGLTTKNYNKLFVGLIGRLRAAEGDKVAALITFLSSRKSEIDVWPDDTAWMQGWLGRDQYKGARQARLRFLFEAIEQKKRSTLNEEIDIKSALTIEHIMPQSWQASWPVPGFDHLETDELDPDLLLRQAERTGAVNKLGNLTLLTGALNTTVSNGPYSVKMPALRAHSSLALNRELNAFDVWNEDTIAKRGAALFKVAQQLWMAPEPQDNALNWETLIQQQKAGLPANGTACRFRFGGQEYRATVFDGAMQVEGLEGSFGSFSAASKAVTQTSRNGWFDWHLLDEHGDWTLADDWRKIATS
ncbi:DUF262 domain-containing protein [Altererythrobacter sp. TH136]|uniref:DUF262 domain-containing protein n=1 Tax=Altererythrobacter sp. TH136 TaxID=2067415 RepID=UPI001164F2AD|nr:DUF262 domain-containing protein [Altererythrobacter sp. TH136]QDM40649.1 DUF262 domain-containing protein [Altererythrobacter sp. TH136]